MVGGVGGETAGIFKKIPWKQTVSSTMVSRKWLNKEAEEKAP